MFSRASLVSVKALRAYHEQGLLIPDSIDPSTGYRSYRVSQLNDATIIRRLRDLDLPLRDVATILRARDPQVTREVIAAHEAEMRRRADEVQRIVDDLQVSAELPSLHTPVHVREEPQRHVLAFTGTVSGADYAPFLDDAYGRIHGSIAASGAEIAGPSGALYPAQVDTDDEPVTAFVVIADPGGLDSSGFVAGVVVSMVPPATCAVMTHHGGYDQIGETYRRLGAWVARHAVSDDAPVREHYVVSVDPATFELLPDDQLRTEISWPIRPGTA